MPFYVRGTKLYPYYIRHRNVYNFNGKLVPGPMLYSATDKIRKFGKTYSNYVGYQILWCSPLGYTIVCFIPK